VNAAAAITAAARAGYRRTHRSYPSFGDPANLGGAG
jgi:hypothetical protein